VEFFYLNPRRGFASYEVVSEGALFVDERITAPNRVTATALAEYLGDPPRKPGKRGDVHLSGGLYFATTDALSLIREASRGLVSDARVSISAREGSELSQLWVLYFVDCLDLAGTQAAPASGFFKGKIGTIKRPVIDASRWDGSELFVVPEDPGYKLFCTSSFVEKWQKSKLKGLAFCRYLFDPHPIEA
jgi:hypothetical protein